MSLLMFLSGVYVYFLFEYIVTQVSQHMPLKSWSMAYDEWNVLTNKTDFN